MFDFVVCAIGANRNKSHKLMKTTNSKKMNQKWYSPGFIIPCVAGISLCASSLSAQEESEEVYELSPFTIEASDSNGYQATNTMAGSRLLQVSRTCLKRVLYGSMVWKVGGNIRAT